MDKHEPLSGLQENAPSALQQYSYILGQTQTNANVPFVIESVTSLSTSDNNKYGLACLSNIACTKTASSPLHTSACPDDLQYHTLDHHSIRHVARDINTPSTSKDSSPIMDMEGCYTTLSNIDGHYGLEECRSNVDDKNAVSTITINHNDNKQHLEGILDLSDVVLEWGSPPSPSPAVSVPQSSSAWSTESLSGTSPTPSCLDIESMLECLESDCVSPSETVHMYQSMSAPNAHIDNETVDIVTQSVLYEPTESIVTFKYKVNDCIFCQILCELANPLIIYCEEPNSKRAKLDSDISIYSYVASYFEYSDAQAANKGQLPTTVKHLIHVSSPVELISSPFIFNVVQIRDISNELISAEYIQCITIPPSRDIQYEAGVIPPSIEDVDCLATLDIKYWIEKIQQIPYLVRNASDVIRHIVSCVDNKALISYVASITADQAESTLWMKLRKYRFTASSIYKCFTFMNKTIQKKCTPAFIENFIKEQPDIGHVESVKWGKEHEDIARRSFQLLFPNYRLETTGIWLHESGVLGASPDSFVYVNTENPQCENDESGVATRMCPFYTLEIKCPFMYRNTGLPERTPYYYKDGDTFFMVPTHRYYHQIQAQIYFTGAVGGFLCVWTPHNFVNIEVPKDPKWTRYLSRALDIYFEGFLPYITAKI